MVSLVEYNSSKILVIVEGERTDVRLMEHLFDIYGMSHRHQIVSYKTNIYSLYNEMFADGAPESLDILQVLKERERDKSNLPILNAKYSDILLIFDFDPHAPDFSPQKISEMLEYFSESSDMGKLYINYPMVESFYHMKSIPDCEYSIRKVALSDLRRYKTIVNSENRNRDYSKFAVTKEECSIVIKQNLEKGRIISGDTENILPDSVKILIAELRMLDNEKSISVLCTCSYYIASYNSKYIE